MKKKFQSLRIRLSLFYLGSLIILAIFFYTVVHIWNLPYSTNLFFALLSVLAIFGFFIIYKITKSLTNLSSQIKLVYRETLNIRIKGITSRDEIGELADNFNNLLNRLNDSFKREQQFIADVAHELKTPLSTQISSFEVALNKPREKDDYKKTIEEALDEANQLSATLKNVLDLAWSETPNWQKNKNKFNLTEVVDNLFEIAQKMAIKKKIKVSLSTTPKIFITGFKDKLARALLNLIDNAIKYSLYEGKIEIILEKTPNKVLVSVIDNGQGISEEDLPHIFDRFYRGSKTDKVFGSGLGLAIAKSIIALHQGEIKVKSDKGKGSTFIVVLPLS